MRRVVVVTALTLLAACEDACSGEMIIEGVREQVGPSCDDPSTGPSFLAAGLFDLRAAELGYQAPLVVESKLDLTLDAARVFFTDDGYGPVTTLPGVDTPRMTRFDEDIALTAGAREDVPLVLLSPSEARGVAEAMGGVLVDDEDRVRVLVWITLAGRLGEVSSEATFPVDVCRGCLIGIDTLDGTRCLDDGTALVEYEVCRRGQEEVASRCE